LSVPPANAGAGAMPPTHYGGSMNLPAVDPDILNFAVDLAEQAGQLAADRYLPCRLHHQPASRTGPRSPKPTSTVEDLIRTKLRNRFPGDGFCGEETGNHDGHQRPPLDRRPHRRQPPTSPTG
jgi:hypothetical protein